MLRVEPARQHGDGVREYGAVSSRIEAALQQALVASAHLDAIVRNTLDQDPVRIADWDRACRLDLAKSSRRAEDSTPDGAPRLPVHRPCRVDSPSVEFTRRHDVGFR